MVLILLKCSNLQFACSIIQPICLGGFVTYFSQTEENVTTLNDAYWYASGIVVSTALLMAYNPFVLYTSKTTCKIRAACGGLIYRKSLRIKKSSIEDVQSGQIINLLSNDLAIFDMLLNFSAELLLGPIEMVIFFIIIYMEIGVVSAVIGMAFLVSFIPLQGRELVVLS